MEEGVYHEPQHFPDGPIDNEYQPQIHEWETDTMVYLATTKHTDIRQAHRPQLNAVARTMAQVNEHHVVNKLTTLRINSAQYLRKAIDKIQNQPIPQPIDPSYTARLQPKALQDGLHIWEPFGGMSCSGAIMHLKAGNNIGTYTHSDTDQDVLHIERALLSFM